MAYLNRVSRCQEDAELEPVWEMVNRSGPAGNRRVGITCLTSEIPAKPAKKW